MERYQWKVAIQRARQGCLVEMAALGCEGTGLKQLLDKEQQKCLSVERELQILVLGGGRWLKGLRTNSEARQQPHEIHTLKRRGESKLPMQILAPAAYGIGRIMTLKIGNRTHMLTKSSRAGFVLCMRGLPFSLEITALWPTGLSHLLVAQSLDFCLPELAFSR